MNATRKFCRYCRICMRLLLLFLASSMIIIVYWFRSTPINNNYSDKCSSCFDEQEYNFNFDYRTIWNGSRLFDEFVLPAPLPYISQDLYRLLADMHYDCDIRGEHVMRIPVDGTIVYVRGDMLVKFARKLEQINKYRKRFVLISHQSDLSVPSVNGADARLLDDPNLVMWFAKNAARSHPKLIALPIGAPSTRRDYFSVRILRETSRRLKPFATRRILIYVNFTHKTNWFYRNMIYQTICDRFGHRIDVDCSMRSLNYSDYLVALGDAKFVISPPGAGVDCYRTWEALMMGAVPVVVGNNSLASLYHDMPVMTIGGNWTDEVTIETLAAYESMHINQSSVARRPKIWAKYWIDLVNRYRMLAKSQQLN